jgi:ribosomal protein L37AE/L43A
MDTNKFSCPSCERSYTWKDKLAGKSVKCKCGETFTVPAAMAEVEPEEDFSYDLDMTDDAAVDKELSSTAAKSSEVKMDDEDGFEVSSLADSGSDGGDRDSACPSCDEPVASGATLCTSCGFSLQGGKQVETSVSKVIDRGPRKRLHNDDADGFFGRLSRSWEFAKISYGIIWKHKQLVVFPVFSMVAMIAVVLSFIIPIMSFAETDYFAAAAAADESGADEVPILTYVIAFAFYFCAYFVIVFFNTALTACAMKVCNGETPTIGYGLRLAMKRLPQIASWALASALVGVILKVIENSSEKLGRLIAAIMGVGWSVLTYFVVPALCAEGMGPVDAIKSSAKTIKETWGISIMGNFSLGLLTFLITLPIYFVCGVIAYLGLTNGNSTLFFAGVLLFFASLFIVTIASSAADVVFKALLYNYATGRSVPSDLDETTLDAAFASRPGK